jgi:hypothetical protein
MCPLANNWPPQYYAPHYYATDLWSRWIFNILMCPLPTTGLLNTMHLTTMQLIFGPKGIFNILMCPLANNWPPYYAPHYYANHLSKEWIFNILMSLANNWPPHVHASTMQLDLLVQRVDIQHFNVLLPTTGLLNTMHLTTMQLIFWSKEWIFNILMCPLATTGLLNTMHLTTMH